MYTYVHYISIYTEDIIGEVTGLTQEQLTGIKENI
jgi:hypothetical protein